MDQQFWEMVARVTSPFKISWTAEKLQWSSRSALSFPEDDRHWSNAAWDAIHHILYVDDFWTHRLRQWHWSRCRQWLADHHIGELDPWPLAVVAAATYVPSDALNRFDEFLHHPIKPGVLLWAYAAWLSAESSGVAIPEPPYGPGIEPFVDPDWPLELSAALSAVAKATKDVAVRPGHFFHLLKEIAVEPGVSRPTQVARNFPTRYPYELIKKWRLAVAQHEGMVPHYPTEQMHFFS
ncbi:MAG: hypothetical protein M1318_07635 [Firmicutes bacterium]|nr:hypothetical protein [Bacillota bacterium]